MDIKKRYIAAGIAVAAVVVAAIFYFARPDLNSRLFAKHYKSPEYEELLTDNTEEDSSVKLFLQAEKAIEMESYRRAIELYDRIIAKNDPLLTLDAKWYKGLCLLKINAAPEKIHNHFLDLMMSPGKYRKKANEILQKKFYDSDKSLVLLGHEKKNP